MANPYPADVADSGGNVRMSGAITFTDANNQPGGGASPVSAITPVTLTAAAIQGSFEAGVALVPAPGPGKAILDATLLFSFSSDFSPLGGNFSVLLVVTTDPTGVNVAFGGVTNSLKDALKFGGGGGELVGFNLATYISDQWGGPLTLMEDTPLYFITTTEAPTGGAGSVDVFGTTSVVTLP